MNKNKILNKTILITYPDSLGNNLTDLNKILQKLGKAVSGVHILPPYPSSGDRGFAPLTHLQIDPKFGSWQDIQNISKERLVSLDLILNHISKDSAEFKDYQEKGEKSEFKNFFINIERDYPQLLDPNFKWEVKRPRPSLPYQEFPVGENHTLTKIWCTFATDTIKEQVDLNYNYPGVWDLIEKYITCLCIHGVKLIRLDAAPYVIKKVGTNCFFLPETWNLVGWIAQIASKYESEVLLEVHGNTILQQEIAQRGYWVYDFALPLLVLHTIYSHDAQRLVEWLQVCPHNQFTTLDTHDGIGIIDVDAIMSKDETQQTVQRLYEIGGNATFRASGENSENFDVYQINTTYYSALGGDDNLYLLARAIQFFTPGIPMVYYVGLFAGKNDTELLAKTHNGRDIDRHYFTLEECEQRLHRPIVKKLLRLMEFRNTCIAFDGSFEIVNRDERDLSLIWSKNHEIAVLKIDLQKMLFTIEYNSKELVV